MRIQGETVLKKKSMVCKATNEEGFDASIQRRKLRHLVCVLLLRKLDGYQGKENKPLLCRQT